jgi:hypothetical protein
MLETAVADGVLRSPYLNYVTVHCGVSLRKKDMWQYESGHFANLAGVLVGLFQLGHLTFATRC